MKGGVSLHDSTNIKTSLTIEKVLKRGPGRPGNSIRTGDMGTRRDSVAVLWRWTRCKGFSKGDFMMFLRPCSLWDWLEDCFSCPCISHVTFTVGWLQVLGTFNFSASFPVKKLPS